MTEASHDPAVAGILFVGVWLDLEDHPVQSLSGHIKHEDAGVAVSPVCVGQEHESRSVSYRLSVVYYII